MFAANQTAHTVTIQDRNLGTSYGLNLPNVYRVSINPSGSAALAFVQDSNLVYSVYKLQANQHAPANAADCEPQNLPVYCLLPVPGNFDRPTKAVFSADGTDGVCAQLRTGVWRRPGKCQLPAGRRGHYPERCTHTAGRSHHCDCHGARSAAAIPMPSRMQISCTSPGSNCSPMAISPGLPFDSRHRRQDRSRALTPSAMGRI